jgi:hypothetical protein
MTGLVEQNVFIGLKKNKSWLTKVVFEPLGAYESTRVGVLSKLLGTVNVDWQMYLLVDLGIQRIHM